MKKIKTFVFGYLLLFFCVAFSTTCSVLLYDNLKSNFENKIGYTALFLLINVFFITFLYALIDYIRRKITIDKPVKIILNATDEITSGNFKVTINKLHRFGQYDAFDQIISNINKMAKELDKSEVLKSDFIANVSHEIKTPITIINNYAQLLSDENISKEEIKEYGDNLLAAAKRLTSLVTNILKLNKLDNQIISETKTEANISNLLAEAILSYEDIIGKKNIELECDIDEVVMKIEISYLDMIWNNLISNAVKFTDEYGKIFISLKDYEDKIIIKVKDSGCGMNKETGERIFEKFYQGDTSHANEGNGLGLALVKRVIDIIGGEISVSSEIGVGSTFMVTVYKEKRGF